MTTITLQEITPTFPTIKTDTIIQALQHLSPKYLPDVLQFIKFLEYKSIPTSLESKENIPAPRQVKVAGKLNTITDRDCSFVLTAEQDSIIKGIAKSIDQKTLSNLLNKDVLVSGLAHFTSTGELLIFEAEQVIIAKAHDMKIWGKVPTPLFRSFNLSDFKVPQGSDSGMSAIYGTWPGDETDEEILKALEELS